jgi:hypothetical protein
MDLLTAHDLLTRVVQKDGNCIRATMVSPDGIEADCWPAAMTAAASLSGMLDDCRDLDDLQEAVSHFLTLLEAEVFTRDQWERETCEVVGAVMDWGDTLEGEAACSTE